LAQGTLCELSVFLDLGLELSIASPQQ